MATSMAKGKRNQARQTHQLEFFFYQKDIFGYRENYETEKPTHDE